MDASMLSELSLCKTVAVLKQTGAETIKETLNFYLSGHRKCLHLNVSRGSHHRPLRLAEKTKKRVKTFSLDFRTEIIEHVVHLRLIRRALSRLSRSLERISSLASSSSTILSATKDRLLAFMSKMMAPEERERKMRVSSTHHLEFWFVLGLTCAHGPADLDQALEGEVGDVGWTPLSCDRVEVLLVAHPSGRLLPGVTLELIQLHIGLQNNKMHQTS